MGPEQPLSILDDQMKGHSWDGTGTGYGVRGSRLQNLTLRFAGKVLTISSSSTEKMLILDEQRIDIQELYRSNSPKARLLYDYSFITALWAIQERFPIAENCTNHPGADLVRRILRIHRIQS